MLKKLWSKRAVRWCLGIYLVLWALTATVGLWQVDRDFDHEFAEGSLGMGSKFGPDPTPVEVQRVPFRSIRDPAGSFEGLPERYRCRSRGIPVAPFLILDEASWQTHCLAGYSGRRLVFWYVLGSSWLPVWTYWVS